MKKMFFSLFFVLFTISSCDMSYGQDDNSAVLAPVANLPSPLDRQDASYNPIIGVNSDGNGYGVIGSNNSTSGSGCGVYGESSSLDGYGVCGRNTSINGVGVLGTGNLYGIEGDSSGGSNSVTGVLGIGGQEGVWGKTTWSAGYGVFGQNPATSGMGTGVYGTSASPDGYGLEGTNTAGGCGIHTPNKACIEQDIIGGGVISVPNNVWGAEQVVQCSVGVPCRCPPKTVRTGQLETQTPNGIAMTEMYCQSIGI